MKLNAADLQLYLKPDSSASSCCEFYGIFGNTFFTVSIAVKGDLANETANYDAEIKTYHFEPEV